MEKPADGNDWVLCFGRGEEALNSSQRSRWSCGISVLCPDGLDTEAADSAALVAFLDAEDNIGDWRKGNKGEKEQQTLEGRVDVDEASIEWICHFKYDNTKFMKGAFLFLRVEVKAWELAGKVLSRKRNLEMVNCIHFGF
ncbi:hypothetical protein SLA2020_223850 [Shorea laevis]